MSEPSEAAFAANSIEWWREVARRLAFEHAQQKATIARLRKLLGPCAAWLCHDAAHADNQHGAFNCDDDECGAQRPCQEHDKEGE